jgi:hypothetical protein
MGPGEINQGSYWGCAIWFCGTEPQWGLLEPGTADRLPVVPRGGMP